MCIYVSLLLQITEDFQKSSILKCGIIAVNRELELTVREGMSRYPHEYVPSWQIITEFEEEKHTVLQVKENYNSEINVMVRFHLDMK